MPLTRDTWPSAAAVRASLMAQFTLPPLPATVHDWLAWYAALAPGQSLYLGPDPADAPEDDDGMEDAADLAVGVLTGVPTVDVPSLFHALDGYRFVLDARRSTPDHLVWADVAATGPGDWQPHWLVLQNAGGDPLIADVRTPEVPIYTAPHGAGRWDAALLCASLAELMQAITVYRPERVGDAPPAPRYTVRLVDLGPVPLRALLALKQLPAYRDWGSSRLMALKDGLPLTLVHDTVSLPLAERLVRQFEAVGARVALSKRLAPRA
ncbi:hypothetical protein CCO03_01690 [Comamonas serinivorans]|uniref:Knr4/Smi1-like domain-containing protein n=1 Tax=Comamonas serinivorans TaxID=1082851 RepID=A0A1Y0EJF9_9BURK|nr:hypothetical protein [Comamonas serinivorans]ARU03568.1 hypothetical protein CCO03_01690 [Comamonas serinivorans]